ncbi:hypothetical protein MKW98_022500 [Papaver atlanticum]|uniref:F-box domain-containing protein n=1 Tax=Papaver atlanticum TaxID=357466 RepID=A0AAD4XPW5_9MAGN|nr:hypothetical protein MKW98_022500 [Papaver atlanticum]
MAWSCSKCTFLNPPSQKSTCQICLYSPSSSASSSSPSPSFSSSSPTATSSASLLSDFEDLDPIDPDGKLDSSIESTDCFVDVSESCSSKSSRKEGTFSGTTEEKKEIELHKLKVLSYNVWFNEDLELHKRMKALGDLIQLHTPDVICLQEVTPAIYQIFQQSSCSVSYEMVNKPYFCMQLSKLPIKSFSCKPFSNSIMGRELCLTEIEVGGVGGGSKQLVIATSHLESPCPAPPTWNQMFSKERVAQAKEAILILKGSPNVILGGDMNWDDKLDGQFPLPDGWVDAWSELKPGDNGYTYDTKSNQMLSGNRTLQKRLDRFMCNLQDFKICGIELIVIIMDCSLQSATSDERVFHHEGYPMKKDIRLVSLICSRLGRCIWNRRFQSYVVKHITKPVICTAVISGFTTPQRRGHCIWSYVYAYNGQRSPGIRALYCLLCANPLPVKVEVQELFYQSHMASNNDSQNQQSTYLGKAVEVCNGGDTKNQWDKLPNDMLERLLGLLPTEEILWCQMVSKTWYTILHSASFHSTSNQLFERCPWFLLGNAEESYVYSMETGDLNPIKLKLPKERFVVPIAGSGGLVCFVSKFDDSSCMCNPYTGMVRTLPCFDSTGIDSTKGIAMHYSSSGLQYKVFVLYGNMQVKVFSSLEQEKAWIELPAAREYTSSGNWWRNDLPPIIGKKGITVDGSEGQILVYYLLQNITLICFNEEKGTISVCPQLSFGEKVQVRPVGLGECGGRVSAVIATRGRRIDIWEFDYKQTGEWSRISSTSTKISTFSRVCEISCTGNGDYIMVYMLNIIRTRPRAVDDYSLLIYNIKTDTWKNLDTLLPNRKVLLPCAFKPDIRARV